MKITLTQAKAIARTLSGGICKFVGNISDEPGEKLYFFTSGIFSFEIPGGDEIENITVLVMNEFVGTIDIKEPVDFTFSTRRPPRPLNLYQNHDNPADVLGGKV